MGSGHFQPCQCITHILEWISILGWPAFQKTSTGCFDVTLGWPISVWEVRDKGILFSPFSLQGFQLWHVDNFDRAPKSEDNGHFAPLLLLPCRGPWKGVQLHGPTLGMIVFQHDEVSFSDSDSRVFLIIVFGLPLLSFGSLFLGQLYSFQFPVVLPAPDLCQAETKTYLFFPTPWCWVEPHASGKKGVSPIVSCTGVLYANTTLLRGSSQDVIGLSPLACISMTFRVPAILLTNLLPWGWYVIIGQCSIPLLSR